MLYRSGLLFPLYRAIRNHNEKVVEITKQTSSTQRHAQREPGVLAFMARLFHGSGVRGLISPKEVRCNLSQQIKSL